MCYSKLLILLSAAAMLSACGGGDVAINPTSAPSAAPTTKVVALNGIWSGDYTDSSGTVCTDVQGLIYNGGVRVISKQCNIVLAGTLRITGSTANISFDLFDAQGASTGQSSFSGNFTRKSSIDGSLDNGSRLSLNYQIVYENNSSLDFIAANWGISETVGSTTYMNIFNIGNAGKLVTQLSVASSCNYAATFSILDANYNLYGMALTISKCTGSLKNRNGVYSGVASLSGDNKTMTVLAGNDQNAFFADFGKISGTVN